MQSNEPSVDDTAQIPATEDAASASADEGKSQEPSPSQGETQGQDKTQDQKARPKSRRRVIVRRTAKTVVGLGVVLAFLALGDRWAVLYAENVAASEAQKALHLRAAPEVHIDGFPFVATALTGDLDHVEVNIPDISAGPVSVAQVKANVDDIHIDGLPTSVKGVVLGKVRGDVFLDFEDLNREVGASQIHLTPGREKNTVDARGDIPVGGTQMQVRARGEVQRVGDRGVALTVSGTRLVIPGVLTYTPGKGGGLQLAAPAAGKVDEGDFKQTTGQRLVPGRMMKGKVLDTLIDHPALLKPAGIDPSLLKGLQKTQEPKVAEAMEFSAELPKDMPGDLGLRDISVRKDGIAVQLTGTDVPVG
ncbi:DUF2993 domain-containing protein [Streptomyces sp. NPDC046821]|uniref:LmeA family phospholipid-binding protein n=1 Tax=Streptomyces sp. NPDC046821 TaxID=3154702 RepID=UPI0033CF3F63